MDIAGSVQAARNAAAARATQAKGQKVKRGGRTAEEREVSDLFESIVEETLESDSIKRLAANNEEQAREDVKRQPPAKPGSAAKPQQRIDLEA